MKSTLICVFAVLVAIFFWGTPVNAQNQQTDKPSEGVSPTMFILAGVGAIVLASTFEPKIECSGSGLNFSCSESGNATLFDLGTIGGVVLFGFGLVRFAQSAEKGGTAYHSKEKEGYKFSIFPFIDRNLNAKENLLGLFVQARF